MEQRVLIRRILDEHRQIRGHLKLIGDTVSDREAMSGLESARANLAPGQEDKLAETQANLQRIFGMLDEGLRNHFAFEESTLVSILGAPLMTALEMEHQEVKKEMESARTALFAKLDGISRKELLEAEGHMHQDLSRMHKSIEGHATREEVILHMLEKSLQAG